MTHAPSDGPRLASHQETREGRGRKTVTAPRLCDGNGAPLSKAASAAVITSPLPQIQITWKM